MVVNSHVRKFKNGFVSISITVGYLLMKAIYVFFKLIYLWRVTKLHTIPISNCNHVLGEVDGYILANKIFSFL